MYRDLANGKHTSLLNFSLKRARHVGRAELLKKPISCRFSKEKKHSCTSDKRLTTLAAHHRKAKKRRYTKPTR